MSTHKIYPLKDVISPDVLKAAGLTSARDLRAVATGDVRPPKKGEWYLSGAIVEAYQAHHDFKDAYHIARLVEIKTTIEIKQWLDEKKT